MSALRLFNPSYRARVRVPGNALSIGFELMSSEQVLGRLRYRMHSAPGPHGPSLLAPQRTELIVWRSAAPLSPAS